MHFHSKLLALQVLQVVLGLVVWLVAAVVLLLALPLVLLVVHPSARFPSTWL